MDRSICLILVLLVTAAAMHTAKASAFFGWQVARVAAADVLMVRAFPDPTSRILVGYPSGAPLSLTGRVPAGSTSTLSTASRRAPRCLRSAITGAKSGSTPMPVETGNPAGFRGATSGRFDASTASLRLVNASFLGCATVLVVFA